MSTLIVVNNPSHWSFHIPGVEVVSARSYLTDPRFIDQRRANVFNLSRSYRYNRAGYYVSLIAEARGHRPRPTIATLQGMRSQAVIRSVSGDLARLIQKSLSQILSAEFTLSIYFGRNLARRHARLSIELFNLFEAPLLRAGFQRDRKGTWHLQSISTIAANEIPDSHRPEVVRFATEYFGGRRPARRSRVMPRYDLAILVNPDAEEPPSDELALRRFERAAVRLGLNPEFITKDHYGRLSEFDALFIRETTLVNHHTYRFSQRAELEGLAVIDDPQSIVRCTNKVYMAEAFERHRIKTPRTRIVHRENVDSVLDELGLPCVLKLPDSSFSSGVVKVDDAESLRREADRFLDESDLFIAQEFMPTEFDWRVGVFEGKALYVCKYHMAPRHWQIINWRRARGRYGRVETLAVADAPRAVVGLAVRAARLVGNGFYGVDIKQSGRRVCVIEVNDNPSVDAGCEDKVLGAELYRTIMAGFLRRIERRAQGRLRS